MASFIGAFLTEKAHTQVACYQYFLAIFLVKRKTIETTRNCNGLDKLQHIGHVTWVGGRLGWVNTALGIEPASEFPADHNLSSLEQADNGRGTKGRIRVVLKILSFSVISTVFSDLHL